MTRGGHSRGGGVSGGGGSTSLRPVPYKDVPYKGVPYKGMAYYVSCSARGVDCRTGPARYEQGLYRHTAMMVITG